MSSLVFQFVLFFSFLFLFFISFENGFLFFLYNHFFYCCQCNFFSCGFDINILIQNYFDTIFSKQYSSLPFNLVTYIELGYLRTHSKSWHPFFYLNIVVWSCKLYFIEEANIVINCYFLDWYQNK
jgi:hypothetical protein